MSDLKSDLTHQIIYGMLEVLSEAQAERLKNVLSITLDNYEIVKKERSLTVYNGNELEYLMKKFIVTKKVEGCTDRTLEAYGKEIFKILRKINKPVKEIKSDDILIYLANRSIKDKVSKTTQDNELRYLRTFFAFLSTEEYISINPCLKIKAIKAGKKRKKAFTELEIERIRNACRHNRDKALVELLLSTGCRAFEASIIKIDDIKENQITIMGKGEKERTVYLNAKAQIAIENYLNERKDKNPYLFPKVLNFEESIGIKRKREYDYQNPDLITEDESVDREYPNRTVKALGKKAGVENTHAHRFRRTCATLALKRGMPLLQVSKMLGHQQLSTTQIYLDISEEELEQAHKKYVV